MNNKQDNHSISQLAIAFLLTLANLASFSLATQAQTAYLEGSPERFTQLRFTPPPLPDRGLPPGRSEGGASRSEMCQAASQPLTALVPTQKANSTQSAGGLTISASPTLWFNVPYSLKDEDVVEFVLQDEQQNTVYQTTLEPSRSTGVVSVPLAEGKIALKTDRVYRWYFSVYCEKDNPVFVEGWIQRVAIEPELERQIQQAPPRERIALLAAHGIWYDALTQLAMMRQLNPDDVTLIEAWESLLESAVVSQPTDTLK